MQSTVSTLAKGYCSVESTTMETRVAPLYVDRRVESTTMEPVWPRCMSTAVLSQQQWNPCGPAVCRPPCRVNNNGTRVAPLYVDRRVGVNNNGTRVAPLYVDSCVESTTMEPVWPRCMSTAVLSQQQCNPCGPAVCRPPC